MTDTKTETLWVLIADQSDTHILDQVWVEDHITPTTDCPLLGFEWHKTTKTREVKVEKWKPVKPTLCWVWNSDDTDRITRIVDEYDPSLDVYVTSATLDTWVRYRNAKPLTPEEMMGYFDDRINPLSQEELKVLLDEY